MSVRAVICQHCREKFVREEGNFEKDTKGYYHKSCHQEMLANRASREDFLNYCFSAIGSSINPALIQKQLKEFTTKYRYTESGIRGTLYYLVEIKRMKLNPKMGIAIVPYHYEKARLYFSKLEAVGDLPSFDSIIETKVVRIEVPENKKRYEKIIDLEELFEEGEI